MGLQTYADSLPLDQPAYPHSLIRELHCLLIRNKDLIDSSADSVALRSDCAYTLSDLELHCPHMSEDPFSPLTLHITQLYYSHQVTWYMIPHKVTFMILSTVTVNES